MTIEQFEAFSAAGQIIELERMKAAVQTINAALGKGGTAFLNSIESRIGLIRRGGDIDEEDVLNAQLDLALGKSIGPLSDAGLEGIGIEVRTSP